MPKGNRTNHPRKTTPRTVGAKAQAKYRAKNKGTAKDPVKHSAKNNKARKVAGLKVGDSRVAAHKDNNTSNNKRSNIAIQSRSKNASIPRSKGKGSKATRRRKA